MRLFEGKHEVEGNSEQIAVLYESIHYDESVKSDQFRVEMRNLLIHIADMLDACPIQMEI
ncbi:hypothetical protein PVK06_004086 [Gossypium arboreum]|uniref:Uncharacterized protein n=1 Tax=Gossypium arboreum TaxID=29729 RepID=A0ABR0QSB3_GOSAR|nr:hypothetical protein PVK06_004086 [Gossypium arboreum]